MLNFTNKLTYIVHTSWATYSCFLLAYYLHEIKLKKTIVKSYITFPLLAQSKVQFKTIVESYIIATLEITINNQLSCVIKIQKDRQIRMFLVENFEHVICTLYTVV